MSEHTVEMWRTGEPQIAWTARCSCGWEYTSSPAEAERAGAEHADEMDTNEAMVLDML